MAGFSIVVIITGGQVDGKNLEEMSPGDREQAIRDSLRTNTLLVYKVENEEAAKVAK